MKKVSRNFLFIVLALFLITTPLVLGANILENVLKPFSGIDIGATYESYYPFIDAVLYFILFIGIASAGLGQTFKDNKTISTIVGVMLAIGMSVFEYNTEFNIGKFAPVAALIFFLVIGIFLYNLIKNLTDQTFAAISLAFLVMYGLIQAMAPSLIEWINEVPWLNTIIALMLVASIIGLIYGIISLFKGIKSGEQGVKHQKIKEDRSNKEFNDNQKKEEKALKKEQKAAQKMFQLETELGNISNSIAELEKAEANIAARDHTNRAHQIETLKDLESALNGSWRLQQQLQSAYANASKPEYSSNPQYLESIKTASRQLDDFINRIKYQLTNLMTAIQDSKNIYETDTLKVEQELASKITALSDISARSIELSNELRLASEKMKKAGILEDPNAIKDITDALKTNIEVRPLIDKIQLADRNIKTAQKDIHDLDSRNINELQRAVSVTETNPAKDIGLLRKGLNIGMNTDNIRAENAENKGAINSIAGIINMGYKYLSGDSLRQMYETVKTVHMNTAKILNELMPIQNNNTLERQKDISECITVMNKDNQIIADRITQLIIENDTNIKTDIAEMTKITNGLKTLITTYKTDIANIKTGGFKRTDLTRYIENATITQLPNEQITVNALKNSVVRELLTKKIDEIKEILTQLLKININYLKSNKDGLRDLYIKALEEVETNLEKDIAEQVRIYAMVQTTLRDDGNLKRISDNLNNTKVPDFSSSTTTPPPTTI
ncbi:MAG: hypothetical protein ACP5N1_02740 [Candidatus Woesearchaeota archaeon]